MSFFLCLSVVGLWCSPLSGSPFLLDCMGNTGKFYAPNLSIRQGHMPLFSLQTEVEAGYHFWAGVCRVDVPDSCSLFPKKHVLWDSGLTRWRELKPWVIGWKRVFWRPTLVLTWGERNFGHAMPLRFWSATVAQPRLVWQMPQGTSFFSLCPTYQGTVEANWEKILANRSNGREVREHWQCSEMEKWK